MPNKVFSERSGREPLENIMFDLRTLYPCQEKPNAEKLSHPCAARTRRSFIRSYFPDKSVGCLLEFGSKMDERSEPLSAGGGGSMKKNGGERKLDT